MQINSSDFFAQTPAEQQPVFTALSDCQAQLDLAYERWDELEALQEQISGN